MDNTRTTVEITQSASDAYKQLSARYGIKATVSAGVILLNELSAEDREIAIDKAISTAEDPRKKFVELKQIVGEAHSSCVKILSKKQSNLLHEFLSALSKGPDSDALAAIEDEASAALEDSKQQHRNKKRNA